jgi:predicted metalloprotease with PDZ domain
MKFKRVVVTHLAENTYFATILMVSKGFPLEIDARPSDSIVMALKMDVPIFVSRSLFEDRAVSLIEGMEKEKKYGLTVQNLTPSLAQVFGYKAEEGILVSEVRKGSRAERDGVKRGDIITEIGGQKVRGLRTLRDGLSSGETSLQARVFRKSRFQDILLHPN